MYGDNIKSLLGAWSSVVGVVGVPRGDNIKGFLQGKSRAPCTRERHLAVGYIEVERFLYFVVL